MYKQYIYIRTLCIRLYELYDSVELQSTILWIYIECKKWTQNVYNYTKMYSVLDNPLNVSRINLAATLLGGVYHFAFVCQNACVPFSKIFQELFSYLTCGCIWF